MSKNIFNNEDLPLIDKVLVVLALLVGAVCVAVQLLRHAGWITL